MSDYEERRAALGVRLRRDVAAFRVAASRLSLVGPGPERGPVVAEIAPPASEEAVAAVEAEIGHRLPATLRDFFLQATAHLSVAWSLPVVSTFDSQGEEHWRYGAIPPKRFCISLRDEVSGEAYEPLARDGGITISLDQVTMLWSDWQEELADWMAPDSADTSASRRQNDYLVAWLRHGFRVTAGMSDRPLCIDMANAREEVAIMAFRVGVPPGARLGQTLIEHIGQQGRLGFPGLDLNLLERFRDDEGSRELWRAYTAGLDLPALRRRRLHLPEALVIDADGQAGRAWREWFFGLKEPTAAS